MTTLYLIRHGENDFMRQHKLAGWLPGIHLNDRGRAQAEGLVPAFEGLRLQALYSSPLERAVETSAPLRSDFSGTTRRAGGCATADGRPAAGSPAPSRCSLRCRQRRRARYRMASRSAGREAHIVDELGAGAAPRRGRLLRTPTRSSSPGTASSAVIPSSA
jgi:bisphosphoglycerate-dependent phosphoglycerate mutase